MFRLNRSKPNAKRWDGVPNALSIRRHRLVKKHHAALGPRAASAFDVIHIPEAPMPVRCVLCAAAAAVVGFPGGTATTLLREVHPRISPDLI